MVPQLAAGRGETQKHFTAISAVRRLLGRKSGTRLTEDFKWMIKII